jgi:hypothetical protein
MEICIHAGLHKSGTTTVQNSFAEQFGVPGDVWYPITDTLWPTNHVSYIWRYIAGLSRKRTGNPGWLASVDTSTKTLADVVREAADRGVGKLLISSETLDRLADCDVEGLRSAFDGHRARVVFTVTPPLHRWAAIWQETVKGGLGASPANAAPIILKSALLGVGELEGLVGRFPAEHATVRLVAPGALDADLVGSVARCLGVPWPEGLRTEKRMNESLGARVVALAHLNGRGETAGITTPESVTTFDATVASIGGRRIDRYSTEDFAVPSELHEAAAAERRFLENADGDPRVEVVDPSGLIGRWETAGLPGWYAEVAAGSPGPGDPWREIELIEAMHRATEQWKIARIQGGQVMQQLEAERLAHAQTRARLHRVRAERIAITSSRTWRIAGRLARLLRRS